MKIFRLVVVSRSQPMRSAKASPTLRMATEAKMWYISASAFEVVTLLYKRLIGWISLGMGSLSLFPDQKDEAIPIHVYSGHSFTWGDIESVRTSPSGLVLDELASL